MEDKMINMESVQDYNEILGVETLHPLVSVVDLAEVQKIKHCIKRFGFYCIFLKQLDCGTVLYGRSSYDYREGTIIFIGPGQIAGANDGGVTMNPKGWVLMFHPDILKGTSLSGRMKEYSFFSYDSNEALHTSERERQTIIGCLNEIREELNRPIDRHSKRIIVSNIELLLNHCIRFYDRQFLTRETVNHELMESFRNLLEDYFDLSDAEGIPAVGWFADRLHLSPNYFGDLVKRETGISAQEYIQNHIIEKAKSLLSDKQMTVSQTAYALGYKYPNHLSRMFKRATGITPNEFKTNN